jgi:acetyl esterase/lipase
MLYLKACILFLPAGTTGERIVLVGDSAGGNFAFGVSMKLKELGLRMPDSILSIYPNVNTSSSATPSRITALWDPILPLGVMLACQAVSYHMYSIHVFCCPPLQTT